MIALGRNLVGAARRAVALGPALLRPVPEVTRERSDAPTT